MQIRDCCCVFALVLVSLGSISCRGNSTAAIERMRDRQMLSAYHLQSVTGSRDGDHLHAQVVFAGPGDEKLTMKMHLQLGVPTHLESGTYEWRREGETTHGSVKARSVTFLGGQSDRPSLGGTYELVADQIDLYEVRIPTTEVGISANSGPPPFGQADTN